MKTKKLITLACITIILTSFISCDNDDNQEEVNLELQAIGKDEVKDEDV